MSFARAYLAEAKEILERLDADAIEKMVGLLVELRSRGGRLFILGIGGSAGHASHAVNDFRKIAGMEAYAPTDNVSELTARTNDEGWATVFAEWLKVSRLSTRDAVFVFSVGGGDLKKNISPNLVLALQHAKSGRYFNNMMFFVHGHINSRLHFLARRAPIVRMSHGVVHNTCLREKKSANR